MKVRHSSFLDAPPDQTIDHRYLSISEVAALPIGVFYKKKSQLTRHRFIRFEVSLGSTSAVGECLDDRGHWRSAPSELIRIAKELGFKETDSEQDLLAILGLEGTVLESDAALPGGSVPLPSTEAHMEDLYENYTDMVAQGHFDADSPDLDRMEILTSWVPSGARVLDMGCNSGGFGPPLITRGCDVHGVELSSVLVDAARRRGVLAVRAWAENTPYEQAFFDAVICAELLEHVLDPDLLLAEVRRVLKPEGILVGSVPHGDGPWGHHDIGHHPEHLRAFDSDELRTLLARNAFQTRMMRILYHGTCDPIGIAFLAVQK